MGRREVKEMCIIMPSLSCQAYYSRLIIPSFALQEVIVLLSE